MNNGISADGQGIARQFDESLSEATAIIDQYIVEGDANRPHVHTSFDELALKATKARLAKMGREFSPKDPAGATLFEMNRNRVQELVTHRCTNEYGVGSKMKISKAGNEWYQQFPVDLDLDGIGQSGECPPWALGTWEDDEWVPVPRIYFALLDPMRDSMYEPGKCEAIAVYWDGAKVTDDESRTHALWGVRGTKRQEPYVNISDWDQDGYQHIVRVFGSMQSVIQAKKDLERAIKLVTSPTPTDSADDIDGELPPIPEYEDIESDLEGI